MNMDRSGVLSIPVKLMVCFLVIGLMTPVLMDSVQRADDEISVSGIREDAIGLKDAVLKAYYEGGTAVFADLSIEPGQALVVGGDGPERYVIRMAVNGEVVDSLYIDSPSVPVLNDELWLEGDMTVRIAAASEDGDYGVRIGA